MKNRYQSAHPTGKNLVAATFMAPEEVLIPAGPLNGPEMGAQGNSGSRQFALADDQHVKRNINTPVLSALPPLRKAFPPGKICYASSRRWLTSSRSHRPGRRDSTPPRRFLCAPGVRRYAPGGYFFGTSDYFYPTFH
jgi:hypothetical protein